MVNEIDAAITTLKKIYFFKKLDSYNLSVDKLIQNIQIKYSLSKEQSIDYLYKKAINYDDIVNSKEAFLIYLGL